MKQIVQDLFLLEFGEKKNNTSQLVNIQDVIAWNRQVYNQEEIPTIYALEQEYLNIPTTFNKDFAQHILETYPTLYEVLELGKGKISFCGPDLLHISDYYSPEYFELYFDSCTVEEATHLLILSLTILDEGEKHYRVNNYRFTEKYIYAEVGIGLVRFCCTIFKDKAEILRNIGPSIERQGYNLVDGYFATISGAMTTVMQAFPIDTNFRQANMVYIHYIGCNLMFHGFKETIKGNVNLSNGKILYQEIGANVRLTDTTNWSNLTERSFEQMIKILPEPYYYNNKITLSTNVQEWLGKDYIPYFAGISNDRYVAFNNVKRAFNLDEDLFRLICNYWLTMEVTLAKERLLSLK